MADTPNPQPGPQPDPNAEPIQTPVTDIVSRVAARVAQMADVGGNLDRFNEMVTAAANGDPAAEAALSHHVLGMAIGSVGPEEGASEGLTSHPVNEQTAQALETSQKGASLWKAERDADAAKAFKAKKLQQVKGYADGGPVIPTGEVPVVTPEGEIGTIPQASLASAIQQGYQQASPDQVQAAHEKAVYSTPGQQAATVAEGLGHGLLGPVATGFEKGLSESGFSGFSPQDIEARARVNPGEHTASEIAGLVAPALATEGLAAAGRAGVAGAEGAAALAKSLAPFTQQGVLDTAAEAGARALGLGGEGASTLSKIGSSAVQGAIQNGLYQTGQEADKFILDPQNASTAAQSALVDVPLASIIGGGLGAAAGSVSPLWKATVGPRLGSLLEALQRHAGGVEGVEAAPLDAAIQKTGMGEYVANNPEIKAALSDNPWAQGLGKTLEQSDTTNAGRGYQETLKEFKKQAAGNVVNTFGRDVGELSATPDIDKYSTGKNIANTLAGEYEEQLAPITKDFEDLKARYQDKPLFKDGVVRQGTDFSNPYHPEALPDIRTPGTVSQLSDRLAKLADREGWIGSGTEMERELNRVLRDLPKKQTLSQLGDLASQVGNNTKSTLPFGQQTPLSRAGSLIRREIQEAADTAALQHLGAEAPGLVQKFSDARNAYREQSLLREQLNDRLKVNGSTSGFAKGLREMGETDGEAVLNRLSGKGDAHLLEFLTQNYPKTAQAIRDFHVDTVLKNAIAKAGPGEEISMGALRKGIEAMSPQLREFAIPKTAQETVASMGELLDRMNRVPHNFSNTGRTVDKLLSYLPGSAMGLYATLMGHNPAAGLLIGSLTKTLGRDVPDATRLGLLKFLGSDKPLEAGAFKSMVDFIHASARGESAATRAVSALFKGAKEVLPSHMLPGERDRKRLDKLALNIQSNPSPLLGTGSSAGHYMPEHGTALAQTATSALGYINSQRPQTSPKAPMDPPVKVNASAQAAYNRLLDIAHQPLTVLHRMGDGTLTSKDVVSLQNLYPALQQNLARKITAAMSDATAKGQPIPMNVRIGASLLLGQPLTSALQPQSIQAAQAVFQPPGQPQGQGQAPKQKRSTAVLSKFSKSYATPLQAAEKDRADRD